VQPSGPEIFQRTPARLGEGPCWHPRRQTVWWVDILGRKLFESGPDGGPVRTLDLPQMPGAVAPASDGRLIAALHHGVFLCDPDSGTLMPFAVPPGHDPAVFRFNDGKVDPQGRFWAGTIALDSRPQQSTLYRFDGDKSCAVQRAAVSISNGLAWSPDGRTLYYVDSPTRQVQAFPFEGERGTLGPPRIAFELAEDDGWPDGCCMDAEGCLWLGHWGAAKLTRWDPATGRRLRTVPLPVNNVTSCAFGGAKLDRLFITTAVDADAKKPEPEAGFIFCLDPGVAGLPPSEFHLDG
jgi:sugar lactone lactonase YvrE